MIDRRRVSEIEELGHIGLHIGHGHVRQTLLHRGTNREDRGEARPPNFWK